MSGEGTKGSPDGPAGKQTVTRIAVHDADGVRVRGLDLATEVIGRLTYTELLYLTFCGRPPTADQTRLLDACLVAVAEAGLNPSTLAARMVAETVPGQPQTAIAAGLLTVGDVYAGSSGDCAALLQALDGPAGDGIDPPDRAANTVARYRESRTPLPGFGHGTHRSDDPRAVALLDLAERTPTVDGRFTEHLRTLGRALDTSVGRHVPVNVTGAIAALLLDIGIPSGMIRGVAVVARSGGLVAHVAEESGNHLSRRLWSHAREQVSYLDPDPDGGAAV